MYRLLKLWAQISRQPKLLSGVHCYLGSSYLTATCEAVLSVKEWNRKMKIKQRKRAAIIKKICVVRISVTRKQSQLIVNWHSCPSFVTPLPETVYTFFYF